MRKLLAGVVFAAACLAQDPYQEGIRLLRNQDPKGAVAQLPGVCENGLQVIGGSGKHGQDVLRVEALSCSTARKHLLEAFVHCG